MKKIHIMLIVVFLNIGLFSCTKSDIAEDLPAVEACCGDGGDIPPPPPPPPGDDN